MALLTDLLEQSSARQEPDGHEVVRMFLATDILAQPDGVMPAALSVPGLPRMGDAHPTLSGVRVVDISAWPVVDTPTAAMVRVTYRVPTADQAALIDPAAGGWLLRWGVEAQERETWLDYAGAAMVDRVNYTYELTQYNEGGIGRAFPINASVITRWYGFTVRRYSTVLLASRIDTRFSARELLSYVGTINEGVWNGHPSHSWLCAGVEGAVGESITMSFALAPEDPMDDVESLPQLAAQRFLRSHQQTSGSWDRHGHVVTALPGGDSVQVYRGDTPFQLYRSADWSPLGITF